MYQERDNTFDQILVIFGIFLFSKSDLASQRKKMTYHIYNGGMPMLGTKHDLTTTVHGIGNPLLTKHISNSTGRI